MYLSFIISFQSGVQSPQSCLFVTPWTVAHQAPLFMGILQARLLEWVAISFSRGSSQSRDRTWVSCTAGRFCTTESPEKPIVSLLLLLLSRFSHVGLWVTLWTAAPQAPLFMGILQARKLEWVAMPSSKGSSQPRDQTHVSCVSCTGRRVLDH